MEQTSFGVILRNPEGKVLVIDRKISYAFSSLLSMLLLKETTATRVDEFTRICKLLIGECTPEEYCFLTENWKPEGLGNVLEYYWSKLPTKVMYRLKQEFEEKYYQVEVMWGVLLKIKILNVSLTNNHRFHDFPKSRKCDTLDKIRNQVLVETGVKTDFEPSEIHKVSYTSATGVTYNLMVNIATIENVEPTVQGVAWMDPNSIKMHPQLMEIIRS
jgi:hypothetical protein